MLLKPADNWADEGDIWSREMRVWCMRGRGRGVETDVITLRLAWGAEGEGIGANAGVALHRLPSERELVTCRRHLRIHYRDGEYFRTKTKSGWIILLKLLMWPCMIKQKQFWTRVICIKNKLNKEKMHPWIEFFQTWWVRLVFLHSIKPLC